MLSLEGAATCAVVQNPIACVLLHLSLIKFQQEWSQGVHSGAVWRIRKKQCLRPGVKNCHSDRCVKNVVRQTPVWLQFIISQTMHCHGNSAMWPPCYLPWILPVHSSRHVGKWGVPVSNLSLLVMLFLVFVGECIGKVINFKWLSKNINAYASNLIGKAKFIVAVVGPETLLSTDAASTVARFREH